MSRRVWFRVHSFAGVFGGLLLFVVCWSGTVATLSAEIDWLLAPRLHANQVRGVDWPAVSAAVQRYEPAATIRWIAAPAFAGAPVDAVVDLPDQSGVHVYVDPVTHDVLGESSFFNVARFFRNFHMALYLPFSIGIYIVGALGVLLVVSSVTPFVFFRRWWTRFLKFHPGHGPRPLWSELHKLTGLWLLPFALLIGLTGVWYLAEQMSIDIAGADFIYPAPPQWTGGEGDARPLDELLAAARARHPGLDIRMVNLEGELVSVSGQDGDLLVRDRANMLFIDPLTGAVPFERDAADLDPVGRWVEMVDLLHFGNFGGLPTKILWFVFGLASSGLCLTGAYLHAQRMSGGGARQARWAGQGAALIVSFVVLAASALSAAESIRGVGPLREGAQLWPEVPLGVIAFLVAWAATTVVALAMWWRFTFRPAPSPMVPGKTR